MLSIKSKKLIILIGSSLTLFFTGCSANESEAESQDSISEEMNYTITGLEPGAGQSETNEIAIEAYDSLDGWEQSLSSTGAMLTELDDAIAQEEPIVITAWSPHYMFAKWDIKFLEDPQGIYGEEESTRAIVRSDLKDDIPEAYTILERLGWELSDLEEALLEAEEKEFDEVAQDWVDKNQETVAEWTEGVKPVDGIPIEFVSTSWDDAMFTANVANIVLEQQGFDVTLTPVDPAVLFEAIATGDADASLSPWIPGTHGEFYDQYEDDFEDIGPIFTGNKIGLAVPSYMDIDSIEDLDPKN